MRNYKISSKYGPKRCINFVKWTKYGLFNKKIHAKHLSFLYFCVNLLAENLFIHLSFISYERFRLSGSFLGGALAGAAIGILVAPDKGSNTREKISNTVDEFLKKHNIKLNRKEVGDLIDDLDEAAD